MTTSKRYREHSWRKQKLMPCSVCHRRILGRLFRYPEHQEVECFLCRECLNSHFKLLMDYQIPEAVNQALTLAKIHSLYFPYALNAAAGRYTLTEAKRRNRLRRRELNGHSSDAYNLGRLLSGSFETSPKR